MSATTMTLAEIEALARDALEVAGASPGNAASVARSTRLAERDGIRSHGLLYVPIYAEHVRCGKVDGRAVPGVEQTRPGAVRVDAKSGFAHPAIDEGWPAFTAAARDCGVAAMTVRNSYNCGVLGHHAERLAGDGLVGLCFTHAPASIAPVGGSVPVIGTNPFALAVPDGCGGAALVIDQSASVVAKSEIMMRARAGEPIEPHWALDDRGRPTTDADLALKGSMAPSGGYKGFGVGLMVEVLASCLAGAVSSREASPFSGTAGGPPGTGQCFVAFDPGAYGAAGFQVAIDALVDAISGQPGARVPGARRRAKRERIERDGVSVDQALIDKIRGVA
ncbi:Ldh family oxidoreductase [Microbaculum marinum]|uniref:Ldh family oxidoreductase n=1 Tax=Microbaculum marinum TaxID=1764581 RepID=A0AAW9RJN6_9HYPH